MRNLLPEQSRLMDELRDRTPDLRVRWSDERGAAISLRGSILPWDRIRDPSAIVQKTVEALGLLLGLAEIGDGYRELPIQRDRRGGFRARAEQIAGGLPVYGASLLILADEKRGVCRIQSSFWRDVEITGEQRMRAEDLRKELEKRLLESQEGRTFAEKRLRQDRSGWERDNFPCVVKPELFLHWTEDGFHPAYHVVAWQPVEWIGVAGQSRPAIDQEELFMDAATGKLLWEEPAREGMAYTDHAGDGKSTLEDSGGNNLDRSLRIVREDVADYYLVNRLHTPEISTYNAGGTETGLETKIKGTADLSESSDTHWDDTTSSCTVADRRDSQQPETDCHFNAEEAWNYYHALGWDGFDNGGYGADSPVKTATHIGMDMNAYFTKYSEAVPGPTPGTTVNKYYGYLAFYDGFCDGTNLVADFMAGDPVIFGHEYQHAITFFGAAKSNGEPGHLYGNSWLGGIREGYSDSFGCLRHGTWVNPPLWREGVMHTGADFSYSGYTLKRQPFRRVEYPRSTDTTDGTWYCDHYDDRNANQTTPFFSRKYFVSTLLSHLAFLVGQGGLHQRIARSQELIPVVGVGIDITAEVFLTALTDYFSTIPTNLTGPTLIEAGELLLEAAEDVTSSDRSCEYVMIRRALYAMGLYPFDSSHNKTTYGGEAVMLPWGYSWRLSQPYVGLPALWWKSLDLFINNGAGADYDADIGRDNDLFARVRNIGDEDLTNVTVRFSFCPHGTNLPAGIAGWHTCQDSTGTDCVLTIASLAAGGVNINDVNNPPASQGVKWYLDPAFVTPDVDHFCLRAEIECEAANHDNDCVYRVQSNVSHVDPEDSDGWKVGFLVANRGEEPVPVKIEITHTLPRGYRLAPKDPDGLRKQLRPREERPLIWELKPPRRRPARLWAPYDGDVSAKIEGELGGRFTGQLSSVQKSLSWGRRLLLRRNVRLRGALSGVADTRQGKVSLCGRFRGELDPVTAALRGEFTGSISLPKGGTRSVRKIEIDGHLNPSRTVEFTQIVNERRVGGVTVSIRMPRLRRQVLPEVRR